MGYSVSITTTQQYCCSAKAAGANYGYVLAKVYFT